MMKLHLTQAENNNLITAYGDGFIDINKLAQRKYIFLSL